MSIAAEIRIFTQSGPACADGRQAELDRDGKLEKPTIGKYTETVMSYHISKKVDYGFDDAIEKVTAELKEEGFGVLTEIDVKATLKKKLDVDFRRYTILGACNPNFAHQALQHESKIGTMLPCNVIVQEQDDGKVEISAVDPMASMQAVENEDLAGIADEVKKRLKKVIESV